jgi:hypothetical protein
MGSNISTIITGRTYPMVHLVSDSEESMAKAVKAMQEKQTALRFAALEINYINRWYTISPRLLELVRLMPEIVHVFYLPGFILVNDEELKSVEAKLDRKRLVNASFRDVLDVLSELRGELGQIFNNKEPSRYWDSAVWKPLEYRIRRAVDEAQEATIEIQSVAAKPSGAKYPAAQIHVYYTDAKLYIGEVEFTDSVTPVITLGENWRGFFIEEYIAERLKTESVAVLGL